MTKLPAGAAVSPDPPRFISASDEIILKTALQHEAILLTKDKDFGEMVIRQRLLTHGIVLIRIDELSLQPNVDFIITTLTTYIENLAGSGRRRCYE